MPTYVYKFVDTGETLEVQQSFSDPTLTEAVHPITGATMAVKKVFLPVGVTFRGDGFYKTDSRNGGSKSGGGSNSSSSTGASNGASSSDSSSTSSKDASSTASTSSTSSTTSSSD